VNIALPGDSVQECANTLIAIHGKLVDGGIPQCYSGPLVDAAIRKWKVPIVQRYASAAAIAHINAGGASRDLTGEHDPPISFYRDIIRLEPNLVINTLIGYLGGMKVTKVTADENNRLTRLGLQRPPNGYQLCAIVRQPFADYQAALEVARVRRHQALQR
jgi:hypothetical protein